MWHKIRNTIAATALFFIAFTPISLAEEPAHNHEPKAKGLNVGEMIMHHISDAHEW
ncbi:MAG: F0F1 ATP synthase subunit A, partial [Runella slithyformis]